MELNTPAPRPLPDKANEKRENPAKKAIKGIGSILFPFKKWKSGSVALNAKKDKNPIRKWDTFHIKDNDEEQIDDWKQKHMIRVKKNLDSQSSEFEIPQRPRHISTDLITDDQSTKFPKSQSSSAGKHLSSQSSAIGPRLLSTFALGDISYTSSMGDLGGSSGTITSSAHTFDTNSTPPEDIRGNLSSPSSLNKSVFQKLGRIAPDLFPDEKDGEFSGDYTALLNIARFRKKYAVIRLLSSW